MGYGGVAQNLDTKLHSSRNQFGTIIWKVLLSFKGFKEMFIVVSNLSSLVFF